MAESDATASRHPECSTLTITAARVIFFASVSFWHRREGAMKKIAAVMVLALLPLAGCANPQGASNGPYTAYDSDYDQGYDGYTQPAPYYGPSGYGPSGGQPGYGPAPSASGYGPGPAYGSAYGPGYPGQDNQDYSGQSYYGQSYYRHSYPGQSAYGPTYRPSGYASSYYNPPPPPPPPGYGQSPYYSTYYGCSCRR
jgi:hypothetical protein